MNKKIIEDLLKWLENQKQLLKEGKLEQWKIDKLNNLRDKDGKNWLDE